MKLFFALLLVLVASFVQCYPQQGIRNGDDDVRIIKLEDQERPVDDSMEDEGDVYYPSGPRFPVVYSPFFTNPLSGFLQGMSEMMYRLRQQMSQVLERMPEENINWSKLPGNTTSNTKIVDGHVVTINETTYQNGNDNGASVFRIKVIDIKPQFPANETVVLPNSGEESSKIPDSVNEEVSGSSVEPTELDTAVTEKNGEVSSRPSSEENEIPTETEDVEYYDNEPGVPSYMDRRQFVPPKSLRGVDNDVDVFDAEKPIDLGRDILINRLMSDQGKAGGLVMIDPDAEIIDIEDGKVVDSYFPSQTRSRLPSAEAWG